MAVDIDKMTNVLVVYNTEDAEEVEVRLRMEKIVCARKKIGSGKHGNFLLAMNNFGEEIYVNPEEETAARAVIEDKQRKKRSGKRQPQCRSQKQQKKGIKMLLPRMIAGIALVIIVALYISHLR